VGSGLASLSLASTVVAVMTPKVTMNNGHAAEGLCRAAVPRYTSPDAARTGASVLPLVMSSAMNAASPMPSRVGHHCSHGVRSTRALPCVVFDPPARVSGMRASPAGSMGGGLSCYSRANCGCLGEP